MDLQKEMRLNATLRDVFKIYIWLELIDCGILPCYSEQNCNALEQFERNLSCAFAESFFIKSSLEWKIN